jgi:WD40 repeat protein
MKAQLGFRLPRVAWASFGRYFGALLLVLALATTFSQSAHAVGTFISAPYRVDHIHDTKRNIIYISSQNFVLRYNVGTNTFLSPIQLSGSLGGMDLSPDGDTLAVSNRTPFASAPVNAIFLINLVDGTSRTVTFPLDLYEGGVWTVAYGGDGRILVSSQFNGSGGVPLRRYDPATGQTERLTTITQNSMLCASADRSLIGIAQSNRSDGPWGTYRVSDGAL